ncbi:MAG: 2,4-dihydroxyhept-2-ene-1,7-dioic acid aldolase [Burkholderiaceae bacterium]|nr:MAG: 2,4-dihydroxyhept-2-ene-1,7-dioic acid aldolase [Burkholderiaceae bacterium]
MNRLDAVKQLRTRLRNGGYSIGSWIQIPHASVAEIMGQASYDWVAVDLEHGAISLHQLPDMFRALELGGTLPLVRLAGSDKKDCKQALDAGAGGVIVPMIETADQLIAVRDACRWPPAGSRGVGFSRANLFGQNFDAYAEEAQAPLLIAMIEHIRAVDNLEAILSVEGLDALLIGPYDFSASMGITGQFGRPDFAAAMRRIHTLAQEHAIPCGIHVVRPDPAALEQRIEEGYRFIAYSIDAVFLNTSALNPHTSAAS